MSNKKRLLIACVAGLLLFTGLGWLSFYLNKNYFTIRSRGNDWPMWRYDANRSASSPQKLPDKLYLQWVREYPKLTQAWENPLNQDLMQFDKVYEPVVQGKTLFIGSIGSDRMVALDTETGKGKWAFYVDGPVRFPPVASSGKVYFVSDDGYLYCVDAEQGKLIWKFRGGPRDRKILGNERLISTWPARGGPVLKDGVIYFAAGIWPFMGIFIYALDAETGEIVWENDSTGPIYMKQPHNSPSYAGVAPQGTLVVAGDRLLVPCGRSMPACFDRRTGELLYYHLAKYNKTGGAFVCAQGDYFVNYHRDYVTSIFDLSTGDRLISRFGNIPVMTEDTLFSMGGSITAYDFKNMKRVESERIVVDKEDEEAKVVRDKSWRLRQLWKLNVDASGDLIKAGKRLYAGGRNTVSAIKVLWLGKKAKVTWRTSIEGTAARLIAADNKLFVVTLEGSIYAFSGKDGRPKIHPYTAKKSSLADSKLAKAASILRATGIKDGYCLVYGLETGEIVEALARNSELRIIAVDPDPAKVDRLRRKLDAAGLYGKRISVQIGDPFSFEVAPYLASLTVFENLEAAGYKKSDTFFKRIYHAIRPYGGVACIPVSSDEITAVSRQIEEIDLPNASVREVGQDNALEVGQAASLSQSEKLLLLTREGPLPGAADWTHQYGDIANTVKSDDQLVKLPLGILWFGGSSNVDVLPRHGHGPPEQIIDGRLFIEGIDSFSARDVYTGRVLWKRTVSNLDTFGAYYDGTYANTPLDPSYNQVHIPGANARGTNFVAALDKVYIAKKSSCLILDPATGKTVDEFKLPPDPRTGLPSDWGYIGVYKGYLIAGAGFVHYLDFLEFDELTSDTASKRRPFYNFDITSSKKLIVMDRHTGDVLWTRNSELGFRHNAIAVGDDKIFCIDMIPPLVSDALKRRLGEYHFGAPELMALNLRNGKTIWSTDENVFGTWLSYSKQYDTLIQAGRSSRDMLRGEPGKGMAAYKGKDGTVLWSSDVSYGGPCMLHGDTIITDRYAHSLLTGERKVRTNPLTGEEQAWVFRRNYGCNSAIASEHLLTFRSAAAGFYDLMRDGGTGNFGGFRSSCTSNLIAANGILNAPDYTRTCSCSYQNQASLALVHMPEVEMWTDYFAESKSSIMESSSAAIALADTQGKLTYVNKAFVQMWGYDDEEDVLGESATGLWQPNVNALEALESLSNKGSWRGELVAVREDGSTMDVYLSAITITDETGEPISIMGLFVEITDSAVALLDLDGNVTYVSKSLLRLWGYDDESDVLGESITEFWQTEREALEVLEAVRDEGIWKGEVVVVREDDSTLDVYLSANTVTDESGRTVSIMASFTDISELKEVESAAADLASPIAGGKPIRSVGINLGAPGDRMADDGTLWLEYPRVGGPSPDVPVSISLGKVEHSDSSPQHLMIEKAKVRSKPNDDAEVRFGLSKGAVIQFTTSKRNWHQIRRYDGETGWVKGDVFVPRFSHHSSRIQTVTGSEPIPAWIVASGIKGISSITITLAGKPSEADAQAEEEKPIARSDEETRRQRDKEIPSSPYTVRLYFSEPDEIQQGQRVFYIAIQGKEVLRDFDIVKEAGGQNRPVVKEFGGILVSSDLAVVFTPSSNAKLKAPLICGIEVIAE